MTARSAPHTSQLDRPSRANPPRTVGTALAAAAAFVTFAAAAQAAPVLVLDVDFNQGSLGSVITTPALFGTAAAGLGSTIVAEGGGQAVTGPNASSSSGKAMRLPVYAVLNRPNTPLAVMSIANSTTTEAINIGTQTFSWQADFSQDTNLGADTQDGDNLFQRGLAGETSQWKLSVDAHKIGCFLRVNGVGVQTPSVTISDQSWYRAVCKRQNTSATTATLKLTVQKWNGAAWTAVASPAAVGGAFGALAFPVSRRMSVGGKLKSSDGTLHAQPDQFNGSIDNVQLRIG